MYEGFFDETFPDERFEELPDYFWTPAELNSILFKNFASPRDAIDEIIKCSKTNISELQVTFYRITFFGLVSFSLDAQTDRLLSSALLTI